MISVASKETPMQALSIFYTEEADHEIVLEYNYFVVVSFSYRFSSYNEKFSSWLHVSEKANINPCDIIDYLDFIPDSHKDYVLEVKNISVILN